MDLILVVLTLFGIFTRISVTEAQSNIYIRPADKERAYFVNDKFIVTCATHEGSATEKLAWKDARNREITDSISERIHVEKERKEGSEGGLILLITKVQIEDAGDYTCTSTVGNDELSISFKLIVYDTIHFANTPSIQSGREGDNFILQCNAISKDERPSVSWIKDSVNLPKSDKYNSTSKGLQISNLNRSDAGNYTCQAYMITKHLSKIDTKIITLRVEYQPQIKVPRTQKVYAVNGSVANITCEADGVPEPDFLWMDGPNSIETDGEYEIVPGKGKSTLKITVSEKDQFKDYLCRATNNYGSDETSFYLVKGEAPEPPTVVKVEEKDPNSVFVVVDHIPKKELDVVAFKIEYKKDSDMWEEAKKQEYNKGGNNKFLLTNLNHSTSYVIRVSAKNDAGYSKFSPEVYHETSSPHVNSAAASSQLAIIVSFMYLLLLRI